MTQTNKRRWRSVLALMLAVVTVLMSAVTANALNWSGQSGSSGGATTGATSDAYWIFADEAADSCVGYRFTLLNLDGSVSNYGSTDVLLNGYGYTAYAINGYYLGFSKTEIAGDYESLVYSVDSMSRYSGWIYDTAVFGTTLPHNPAQLQGFFGNNDAGRTHWCHAFSE